MQTVNVLISTNLEKPIMKKREFIKRILKPICKKYKIKKVFYNGVRVFNSDGISIELSIDIPKSIIIEKNRELCNIEIESLFIDEITDKLVDLEDSIYLNSTKNNCH